MFEKNFETINGVLCYERRNISAKINSQCLRTVYYVTVKEKEGYLQFKQKENQAIHCTIYASDICAIKLYFRNLYPERIQAIITKLVKHLSDSGYIELINSLKSMKNNDERLEFLMS